METKTRRKASGHEVVLEPDASSRVGAFKVGSQDELVTELGSATLDDPTGWAIVEI